MRKHQNHSAELLRGARHITSFSMSNHHCTVCIDTISEWYGYRVWYRDGEPWAEQYWSPYSSFFCRESQNHRKGYLWKVSRWCHYIFHSFLFNFVSAAWILRMLKVAISCRRFLVRQFKNNFNMFHIKLERWASN